MHAICSAPTFFISSKMWLAMALGVGAVHQRHPQPAKQAFHTRLAMPDIGHADQVHLTTASLLLWPCSTTLWHLHTRDLRVGRESERLQFQETACIRTRGSSASSCRHLRATENARPHSLRPTHIPHRAAALAALPSWLRLRPRPSPCSRRRSRHGCPAAVHPQFFQRLVERGVLNMDCSSQV